MIAYGSSKAYFVLLSNPTLLKTLIVFCFTTFLFAIANGAVWTKTTNASAYDELAFIAVRKTTDTADVVGWDERGVGSGAGGGVQGHMFTYMYERIESDMSSTQDIGRGNLWRPDRCGRKTDRQTDWGMRVRYGHVENSVTIQLTRDRLVNN